MKILIDADGCPVVDKTIEIAKQYNIECIIICDTSHSFEREGVRTITVSKGADSVDFYLVNLLDRNDIAVTQDYALASMCLAKCAHAINQSGLIYSADNIDALLMKRHISQKIRRSGGRLKGPKKRTQSDNLAFEQALIKLIEENLR